MYSKASPASLGGEMNYCHLAAVIEESVCLSLRLQIAKRESFQFFVSVRMEAPFCLDKDSNLQITKRFGWIRSSKYGSGYMDWKSCMNSCYIHSSKPSCGHGSDVDTAGLWGICLDLVSGRAVS